MTSSSRPIGWGLVVTGAVLAAIMLLWLAVQLAGGRLTPGGAVLGLLLAAVLGLPLLGGGFYLLSRGPAEADAATANERLRGLLERDRASRAAWSRDLRQFAERLAARGAPDLVPLSARLNDLAEDLEAPNYERTLWTIAPDATIRQVLPRYDDLVSAGLRELAEQIQDIEGAASTGAGSSERTRATLTSLERDLSARENLLAGRAAPTVLPADLLASGETDGEEVARLAPGDAVSRDGVDYLIETSASYFAGGRTWWLHRLAAEAATAWLAVGPAALSLGWLEPKSFSVDPGSPELRLGEMAYRLEESWAAAVEARTRQGLQSSGTATIWRYVAAGGGMLWIERWPDRQVVLGGNQIAPRELEIWPATLRRSDEPSTAEG
jgi:Domain of unknown function (DUF4178)